MMHSEYICMWYLVFCDKPDYYSLSFDDEIQSEGQPVDN